MPWDGGMDVLRLTFRRVFETTINHSAQQLGLQNKILEVRGMNTSIMSPGRIDREQQQTKKKYGVGLFEEKDVVEMALLGSFGLGLGLLLDILLLVIYELIICHFF